MHTTKKQGKCWHRPWMVQKCLENESYKYSKKKNANEKGSGLNSVNLTYPIVNGVLVKAIFVHGILA